MRLVLILFAAIASARYHLFRAQQSEEIVTTDKWANVTRCDLQDISADDRCAFVQRFCTDDTDSPGVIVYMEFYYCTMQNYQWLAVILLVAQMAFLFIFLGTASADYFCPNLATMSKILRLSQDVAGVTLLAFGNSAPDVFSSLVAIHGSNSMNLGLGEVVGSVLFVAGIVAGFVALSSPTKVILDKSVFFRDFGFLSISVAFLGVILITGKMYWWQGLLMVLIYVLYVLVVVYMQLKKPMSEERVPLLQEAHIDIETESVTWSEHSELAYGCLVCENRFKDVSTTKQRPGLQVLVCLIRHLFPIFWIWKHQSLGGKILSILNTPAVFMLGLTTPVIPEEPSSTQSLVKDVTEAGCLVHRREVCPNCSPKLSNALLQNQEDHDSVAVELETLSQVEWFHRWILVLQMFLAPLFVLFAINKFFVNCGTEEFEIPAYAIGLIAGVFLAAVTLVLTHPQRHYRNYARDKFADQSLEEPGAPFRHPFLSFAGFVVGIIWIYFIANELVGLLKTFGKIYNISDAILGITVFAWGNSVGDLVSNITLSRMGYARMSISASFAGPLLNLLMILGVSGLIGIGKAAAEIRLNTNMLFTFSGIVILLLFDGVFIPYSKFKVGKSFGYVMVSFYVVLIATLLTLDATGHELPFLAPNDDE